MHMVVIFLCLAYKIEWLIYKNTHIYKRVPGVLMDFKVAERTKVKTPHLNTIRLYRATLKSQHRLSMIEYFIYNLPHLNDLRSFTPPPISHPLLPLFLAQVCRWYCGASFSGEGRVPDRGPRNGRRTLDRGTPSQQTPPPMSKVKVGFFF